MEYLFDYLVFLGKAITIVAAIIVVIMAIVGAAQKMRHHEHEHLEIKPLNKRFEDMRLALEHQLMSAKAFKAQMKAKRKADKEEAKKDEEPNPKNRLFVIDFDGDIRASAVSQLREEVTAVLTIAEKEDEVLVRLESPGGMVHGYGLAASQLSRLRDKEIPLTIAVDKVAASGGYMMACVGDKIIAAPFAIIGSIGVVMQIPNFNKLLKKHDVDVEIMTAGDYKRTLTVFGENTQADRDKVQEELDATHELFKGFIRDNREVVDVDAVGTGEHWYGQQALEKQLVDELSTSDDYLLSASKDKDIYQIRYHGKRSLIEKAMESTAKAWQQMTAKV